MIIIRAIFCAHKYSSMAETRKKPLMIYLCKISTARNIRYEGFLSDWCTVGIKRSLKLRFFSLSFSPKHESRGGLNKFVFNYQLYHRLRFNETYLKCIITRRFKYIEIFGLLSRLTRLLVG